VEGWVKWESFGYYSSPFSFGKRWQAMEISNHAETQMLKYFIYLKRNNFHLAVVPGILRLNRWCHIAAVSGKDGMKLYINGVLVGESSYTGSFAAINSGEMNYFGKSQWIENTDFEGQLDEIRVWNVARTQEQIQKTMYKKLTGKEKNIVGLWNFDSRDARDSSTNGYDGQLMGEAHCVEEELPLNASVRCVSTTPSTVQPLSPPPSELSIPTWLSGVITNEMGQPIPNASVRLEHDGLEIARTQTNASGNYHIIVYPDEEYDLSATYASIGDWQLGVSLDARKNHTLNMKLREAISIEGTLRAIDKTPHVGFPVEVVIGGEVIARTLTNQNGKYWFINLKPGKYKVRCQVQGGYLYYGSDSSVYSFPTKEGGDVLQVESGKTHKDIDFRFAPQKKGTWKNYKVLDGLADDWVMAILSDQNGRLWFATRGGGVSRYDGKTFVTFTEKDGLASNWVNAIHQDPNGVMWFGTSAGVSRYDGEFLTFTKEDGLASNFVTAIHRDPNGRMWVGTGNLEGGLDGGLSRAVYPERSRRDGKRFITFTTKDGLAHNNVRAILSDSDGVLWVGTWGGGVSCYDGKKFVNLTIRDGLVSNYIRTIHREKNGFLWFGTLGGISCYDGKKFLNFTEKDGLRNCRVRAIHYDSDGILWIGTEEGGISRYDGKTFVTFTEEDGLVSNWVNTIHQDPDGVMWFGTSAGVSCYDRTTFVHFTTKDGLTNNQVRAILSDHNGILWFGTEGGGVSRYDGNQFKNFTTKDGLANNEVWSILSDRNSVLWFGTAAGVSCYDGKKFSKFELVTNWVNTIHQDSDGVMWFGTLGGGICRYDKKTFVNLTTEDGLADNKVWAIQDSDGVLWFGTAAGVSRYDGKTFSNIPTKNGVTSNEVWVIYSDSNGKLWIGTKLSGVTRYDGGTSVDFTRENGLGHNYVLSIHRTPDGIMYFGTKGAGVSMYDGAAWSSLDERDGLADNTIFWMDHDENGYLWIGTDEGVTRYRRSKVPPVVNIISVQTNKPKVDIDAIESVTAGTRVTIEYNAIDLKTVPEKRQYRCRIKG
jgi:ligand-binding sensor domain-containing protein